MAIYLLSFPGYAAAHSWPWVVAGVTFPICAGKQIINVVQMAKAAVALAESDLEVRKQMVNKK